MATLDADKWRDLNLSKDEIERLTKALKNEEFRKLLQEYAEEISNPDNRKKYEEEISALETERGVDVKFVHPEPGYVIKTAENGEKKCFINISKNGNVAPPKSQVTEQADNNGKARKGLQWSIPHSVAPPRQDVDKAGHSCVVYDVVFHPDTYRMSEKNARFRKLLNDTAIETIEKNFKVQIDKGNLRFPKLKYKGVPVATVIRKVQEEGKFEEKVNETGPLNFPYPYGKPNEEDRSASTVAEPDKVEVIGPTVPKHSLRYRYEADLQQHVNDPYAKMEASRPNAIIAEVDLPLCSSIAGVDLDVFERELRLHSESPRYQLQIPLTYSVDEEHSSAKFDKARRMLIVTMPVRLGAPVPKHSFAPEQLELVSELDATNTTQPGQMGVREDAVLDEHSESRTPRSIVQQLPLNGAEESSQLVVLHLDRPSRLVELNGSRLFIKHESVGSGGVPLLFQLVVELHHELNGPPISRNNGYVLELHKKQSTAWKAIQIGMESANQEFPLVWKPEALFAPAEGKMEGSPRRRANSLPSGAGLRGILKQARTRTLSANYDTLNDSEAAVRKSVSFSNHVQRNTYKPNSTVAGMRKPGTRAQRKRRKRDKRRPSESSDSSESLESTSPRPDEEKLQERIDAISIEEQDDDDDDSPQDGLEEERDSVDTVLTWNEANGGATQQSEHKTTCAFQFSNALRFSLDD